MHLPEFLNLGAGFSRYFRIRPALDDELRRQVYRIRHSVYCEELGYEPIREDRLESDAYDFRSAHCVLQAVASEEYIGCVRLVLAKSNERDETLPLERLCGESIDRDIVDLALIDRSRIAEVSRLAVVAHYRRRRGEQQMPLAVKEADFGTPDRPRFPYIAAGLYLGMIAQAQRHGIDTLFMLTESRLAKQLTRLGVGLRTIGPPVEHRGMRYPSMMSVRDVIKGFNYFVRPLFAVIAEQIDDAYRRSTERPVGSVSRPTHSSFFR